MSEHRPSGDVIELVISEQDSDASQASDRAERQRKYNKKSTERYGMWKLVAPLEEKVKDLEAKLSCSLSDNRVLREQLQSCRDAVSMLLLICSKTKETPPDWALTLMEIAKKHSNPLWSLQGSDQEKMEESKMMAVKQKAG